MDLRAMLPDARCRRNGGLVGWVEVLRNPSPGGAASDGFREELNPPSYGASGVKHPEPARVVFWIRRSGGARSHAQRSAPPRSARTGTGFRRLQQQLTASPHIRSDRLARTHIPHACGEEATRMSPIYKAACLLAQGWHGHHPSRVDPGTCPDADALVEAFKPLRS